MESCASNSNKSDLMEFYHAPIIVCKQARKNGKQVVRKIQPKRRFSKFQLKHRNIIVKGRGKRSCFPYKLISKIFSFQMNPALAVAAMEINRDLVLVKTGSIAEANKLASTINSIRFFEDIKRKVELNGIDENFVIEQLEKMKTFCSNPQQRGARTDKKIAECLDLYLGNHSTTSHVLTKLFLTLPFIVSRDFVEYDIVKSLKKISCGDFIHPAVRTSCEIFIVWLCSLELTKPDHIKPIVNFLDFYLHSLPFTTYRYSAAARICDVTLDHGEDDKLRVRTRNLLLVAQVGLLVASRRDGRNEGNCLEETKNILDKAKTPSFTSFVRLEQQIWLDQPQSSNLADDCNDETVTTLNEWISHPFVEETESFQLDIPTEPPLNLIANLPSWLVFFNLLRMRNSKTNRNQVEEVCMYLGILYKVCTYEKVAPVMANILSTFKFPKRLLGNVSFLMLLLPLLEFMVERVTEDREEKELDAIIRHVKKILGERGSDQAAGPSADTAHNLMNRFFR